MHGNHSIQSVIRIIFNIWFNSSSPNPTTRARHSWLNVLIPKMAEGFKLNSQWRNYTWAIVGNAQVALCTAQVALPSELNYCPRITSSTTPLEIGPENSINYPPPLEFTEPHRLPPLEIGPENSINYPPSNSRNLIDYPPLEIGPENSINYPPSNSRNLIAPCPFPHGFRFSKLDKYVYVTLMLLVSCPGCPFTLVTPL